MVKFQAKTAKFLANMVKFQAKIGYQFQAKLISFLQSKTVWLTANFKHKKNI